MKTVNFLIGGLILASLVVSFQLHQIVTRYDAMELKVDKLTTDVDKKIGEFTSEIEKFKLRYGDEVYDELELEAKQIEAQAKRFADSLMVSTNLFLEKRKEYLENLNKKK